MRIPIAIGKRRSSVFPFWFGIATAILMAAALAALVPSAAKADPDPLKEPGISVPKCESDGISMFWHTRNRGDAEAPDGWKVERRSLTQNGWVATTFTFIGPEADALHTVRDDHWDWTDTSAERDVDYIYRVRAINSDGTDMDGRIWSRGAEINCTDPPDQSSALDQPGISIPLRQGEGVAFYWHTRNRGEAEAPDGWKVERRNWTSDGWVLTTFTFIGDDSDALQTYSDKYWDWVDTSADQNIDYTYRVRAINADRSYTDDRIWSRRAPVKS